MKFEPSIKSLKKRASQITAAALIAVLAGCSVLTVDIDVYKGPLVNDDVTQVDQVISLAMGARPLIVELLHDTVSALGVVEKSNRYSPDLHEKLHEDLNSNNSPGRRQAAKQAIFLNDLIGLYSDTAKDNSFSRAAEQFHEFAKASEAKAAGEGYAVSNTNSGLRSQLTNLQNAAQSLASSDLPMAGWLSELSLAVLNTENAPDSYARQSAYGDLSRKIRILADSSLQGGRRPEGVETAIINYQEVSSSNNPDNQDKPAKYSKLLSTLAELGQKLVVLGNPAITGDDVKYVPSMTGTPRLGAGNSARPKVDASKLIQTGSLARQTLQYVGNSILIAINQIRQKANEDLALTNKAGRFNQTLSDASFPKSAALGHGNMKDAAESLTQYLRLKYIHLMKSGGNPTNTNSLALLEAINQATLLRGEMIHIKPASAYLRSSFPIPSLQPGTQSGRSRNNMLVEHAIRQSPLTAWIGGGTSADHARIKELDAQSWQNVNRVRVAGAGNANYVVAKDDIGNWYVKEYSTNPSNIINSAKNLALFAAGNAFGSRIPPHTMDGTPIRGAGPVETQLQAVEARYADRVVLLATNAIIQRLPLWKADVMKIVEDQFGRTAAASPTATLEASQAAEKSTKDLVAAQAELESGLKEAADRIASISASVTNPAEPMASLQKSATKSLAEATGALTQAGDKASELTKAFGSANQVLLATNATAAARREAFDIVVAGAKALQTSAAAGDSAANAAKTNWSKLNDELKKLPDAASRKDSARLADVDLNAAVDKVKATAGKCLELEKAVIAVQGKVANLDVFKLKDDLKARLDSLSADLKTSWTTAAATHALSKTKSVAIAGELLIRQLEAWRETTRLFVAETAIADKSTALKAIHAASTKEILRQTEAQRIEITRLATALDVLNAK